MCIPTADIAFECLARTLTNHPSPPRLDIKTTFVQTFQQHCEYVRTPRGVVLQPLASLGLDKWLVVFCDEINLPSQVLRDQECSIDIGQAVAIRP